MGAVEVKVTHMRGMEHKAQHGPFSFSSDEPPSLGGRQAHPLPLAYFTASIGLCAMTQIVRFADQMRIRVDDVTGTVISLWDRSGSVLAGTVESRCVGFSMDLDVRSPAPGDHVAALVQNAHAGCFAEQALLGSTTINSTATLNGTPLEAVEPQTANRTSMTDPVRHFPIQVELRHVGGVSHEARWNDFKFFSDEPPHLGGEDKHPIPIAYFAGSVGFCVLTQVVRFADQLEIPLQGLRSRTVSHFSRQGSVKAGTVLASLDEFDVHVDVTSPANAADIAFLLGLAHRGCYAENALLAPVTIDSTLRTMAKPSRIEEFPRRVG